MSEEVLARPPVIGITPSPSTDTFSHGTFERYALSTNYARAIEHAGGIPIVLVPQLDHLSHLVRILDGVLLSGGGDIRPSRYGDSTVHPETYGIHDLRDEFELALARSALELDLPLLCICRGIQVLNVALGGTLIQDIGDQVPTTIEHRQQRREIPSTEPSHEVEIVPGSLLHAIYGDTVIAVNSFHHQALREVASELRVVGRAPDGIVEAVELAGRRFVLGVQWHPEMMFEAHPEHLKPFRALVEAAEARRAVLAFTEPVLGAGRGGERP
ncbi:gamma-glutamyl-gamma-aminobutyrate hydrolase family protein [Thermomicrobiaceae bacterium CFH 74404]|uniref:gamma-glutamyl-gamma-aminobutyrate hydrolase n=1 Tax=Thermalbibacter longus TaxID=2951981 RepID=A0AA41WAH3_9BACT|nr:gamma-glutamyl-gamma-aminobutyrate hydrolase family protein [Thermalbibacter longus]MCM8749194.1 gamma-glutamyl-gamma-aminobutyrate hydrolase family protein [Thermalbibacter longus]